MRQREISKLYVEMQNKFPGVTGLCEQYGKAINRLHTFCKDNFPNIGPESMHNCFVGRYLRSENIYEIREKIQGTKQFSRAKEELKRLETLVDAREKQEVEDFKGNKRYTANDLSDKAREYYSAMKEIRGEQKYVCGEVDVEKRQKLLVLAAGAIIYAQEAIDLGEKTMGKQRKIECLYIKAQSYGIMGDDGKRNEIDKRIMGVAGEVKAYHQFDPEILGQIARVFSRNSKSRLAELWNRRKEEIAKSAKSDAQ